MLIRHIETIIGQIDLGSWRLADYHEAEQSKNQMNHMPASELPIHSRKLFEQKILVQIRQELLHARRSGRWSAGVWALALIPGSYFAITNFLQHAFITNWFGSAPFALLAAVAFFLCYNTYSIVVRAQWFLTGLSFQSRYRLDVQAIIHIAMILIASFVHLFLISVLTATTRSSGSWISQTLPYFEEIWVSCLPIWILLYLTTLVTCKLLQSAQKTQPVEMKPASPVMPARLSIRDKGIVHYVEPLSIRQVVAEGDYVKLHTADQLLMPKGSISKFEDTLKSHGVFIRVHRSCLVRADCIKSLSRTKTGAYRVELDDGTTAPLSRRKIDLVKSVLDGSPSILT